MEVEIQNAITAEGLGDGKKPPLKLPADLPTDGLVLAPPFMAQAVIDGKKTVIVKTKALELDGKDFILLSQRKALGVVNVGKGEKIDDDEFTELEPKHLITAKIRADWAKAQPSWKKGPLYAWPIKVVQKFDEPLDTNVKAGPQVTVTGVEIKATKKALAVNLAKIKDVKTYDPSKVSDAVLRDDFRILLGWYATWKKDPEKFRHSLETITELLRKVLKETVRRGPKVIQFSPQGMKASVRAFFMEVARDIKLPDTMIRKVALDPGMEVDDLSDPELYAAHWQLHEMFEKEKRTQTGVKGWSTEDIVNLHARAVDELFGRKTKHPPPPDNGLDELSVDFEQNAAKQPEWFTKPTVKISKREYATINHSGVKRGKEIKIEDVLKHFKTFKLRKPYIYLVGGLANHGKTKGDIDILVKDSEELPENFKHALHFRLGRALPPELAERLEIHYDNFHGPFTNFSELYDLTFERVNEKNEIKEMSLSSGEDVEKQEAATAEMKAQADKAAKNDKLTLGEFFYQPKPTRAAQPEQLQTLENFMALYKERAETWLPTVVQKKFDGSRHQLHIDGDTVKIFSEDGSDNTDRFPQTIEELKTLKVKKLVLDAEIERWDGRQHLPREAAAGYINSKDEPDDSEMITNVFDVLYHGEDIHKLGTKERLALLKKLGIKQSTMGVPNLKHRLNAAPGIEVDDLEELESAVRRIRKLPGSEGVVNKRSDAPYVLKVVTPDTWTKFHNATQIGGIVMGRTKTKGGVWVYQYGVLPGKEEAEETVGVKGTKVIPVGDTFATKLDFEEGDGILIEAETVNVVRSPKGLKISAWVPRVIGELDRKTDTVDQVARRAARNLVLQQKDIDEEGKITYRPTRKTVKIGKQEDPYMEIPDEDKTYRYSVSHHHRGKSLHADLRLGLRPNKLLVGWTLNTQIAGSIKEPVVTMPEARRLASKANIDKVSKINWHTGEWARRPRAGTTKLVRTEILSERKSAEPWAWIDVEGKTKDPEEGKAPPVGGTRQFPGVFLIVDQGTVEWGCFPPNEPVLTSKGLLPIKEVEKGMYLFGDNDEWVEVIETFTRQADRLVTFNIRGLQAITVTPNHPIWGLQRDASISCLYDHPVNPQWFKADELTVGDYVSIPRIKAERRIFVELRRTYNAKNGKRGEERSIKIDCDLAWLLGFFMGDGYASQIEPAIEFAVSDPLLKRRVEDLMQRYFDQRCRSKRKIGCWAVYCYSSQLQDYLRKTFYDANAKKTFPISFLFLERNILRHFMRGYYAADGRKKLGDKDQLELTTVNHEIYKLSQLALAKLGVVAGGTSARSKAYRLLWLKKYLNLLDDEPETEKRARRDYLEDDDYFYLRIKGRSEEEYAGPVHNLETEDHTIYTPIRTHNSQKPWLHEQFYQGGGLNYRMFFRLLKLSPRKAEKSCEACGTAGVGADIGWADEPQTPLCKSCTTEYLEKQGVVLPPSEEQPFKDEATWLAIYPDDQTPYVLSSDAVKKDWMPPDGISALPREIRTQIPKEFHYWEAKGKKAKEIRDSLFEAIKDKDVEIDVEAPYKSAEKATQLKADFVLQEQTWRGPTQVRVGPTRTRYWVRLDIGRKDLLVLDLRRNPLDNPKVGAFVDWDSHKASMKLKGDISPGHYLNPTKETPSFIEVLDKGKAEVLSLSDDLIKIKFKGKKLKELIGVKRSNDEWLWSPSQAAPEIGKTEKRVEFELNLPIVKIEVSKGKKGKDKRLITGIVLEPNVVDGQGDIISAEVIEKAAHQFVRDYNKSTEMGLMHNVFGENGIELVESWVAPIAFKLNNKSVKKGSWVMTAHISDDTVWKKIKSGEITGFSIGGVATVANE